MSAESASARDVILAAVRAALPPATPRPDPLWPSVHAMNGASRADAFASAATGAGASVVLARQADVARLVAGAIGDAGAVLSYLPVVTSTVVPPSDVRSLDTLDVVVLESALGVAENGAVWIATDDVVQRAALFLAAQVVIVVAESALVDDLHQAYERIEVRAHAFGAFVAGPSKTADIEQALVIGAHGPKELTLVLVRATDAPPP